MIGHSIGNITDINKERRGPNTDPYWTPQVILSKYFMRVKSKAVERLWQSPHVGTLWRCDEKLNSKLGVNRIAVIALFDVSSITETLCWQSTHITLGRGRIYVIFEAFEPLLCSVTQRTSLQLSTIVKFCCSGLQTLRLTTKLCEVEFLLLNLSWTFSSQSANQSVKILLLLTATKVWYYKLKLPT